MRGYLDWLIEEELIRKEEEMFDFSGNSPMLEKVIGVLVEHTLTNHDLNFIGNVEVPNFGTIKYDVTVKRIPHQY